MCCEAGVGGNWVVPSRVLSAMGQVRVETKVSHITLFFLACWVAKGLHKVLRV
jgi:hypothetical protein